MMTTTPRPAQQPPTPEAPSAALPADPPGTNRRRPRRRAAVIGVALVAALAVWLAGRLLVGHTMFAQGHPGRPPLEIGPGPVVVITLLAGLLGWGTLALLERAVPRRARAVWTVLAVLVLAASFQPLTDPAMPAGTRVALAAQHLVVAAVLLAGLPRGLGRLRARSDVPV